METHSRAYSWIVWILRGLALWLFLQGLFFVVAGPYVREAEGASWSFQAGREIPHLLFLLGLSALLWYVSVRIGRSLDRVLVRELALQSPDGPAAAPGFPASPSEPLQPGWRARLRRRRAFCFVTVVLGLSVFGGIDRVRFNFDQTVLGVPEGYLWLGVLLLAPVAAIVAVALWRCPGCGVRLPNFKPPACPHCGLRLFDDGPAPL
jgi:hypothetical protein